MKIYYALAGKDELDLEVADATQIPREGDVVWLKMGESGNADLFKVLKVAWRTELINGDETTHRQYSEKGVVILIEPAIG